MTDRLCVYIDNALYYIMPMWMSAGADGLHVSKSQQWAMAVFFPSEFDHLSTDEIITFYFVAGYKYSMISKFYH